MPGREKRASLADHRSTPNLTGVADLGDIPPTALDGNDLAAVFDLLKPSTTVFEFGGLHDQQREYILWALSV